MGRRVQPTTLKTICIISICKNMKKIWCADYIKNFHDQGNFLHVIGPLSCLTSDLVQELINCLVTRSGMIRQYLHVLLDGRQDKIDLSVCRQAANKDAIINLLAVRCKRLTHLNISGCSQVSPRALADLVEALPNLVQLNLRKTNCTDQVLAKIGICLANLRELDISGCKVTDCGAMSLCVSFPPDKPKVRKLYKLDISYTAISIKGAAVVLKNCPSLQVLHYPDSCDAIYQMSEKHDEAEQLSLPQLRTLNMSLMQETGISSDESLFRSCEICPNVTEVSIQRGATDTGIIALSSLQHLRVLHLSNNAGDGVTFENGLVPVLQMQGAKIEKLELIDVNYIDIAVIGQCCPLLKKFSCIISGYEPASFPLDTHPELMQTSMVTSFQHLEDLSIQIHTDEGSFPSPFLRLLLLNASKIKSLHLVAIEALDDDVLIEVIEKHKFNFLESLVLERCNSICLDPIYDICEEENALTKLHLISCREITRIDREQLEMLVEEENMDIEFEWI